MPKRAPEAEWEKRAKVALSEGDGLTALRILETVPFHAAAQPGFPYLYARALPQMRHSSRARAALTHLLNRGRVTCDTVSLLGRPVKVSWLLTDSPPPLSPPTPAIDKRVSVAPG